MAQTAIQEWAALLLGMIDQAQEIVDLTAKTSRLQDANQIAETIAAAQPGEFVGDTSLTKERAGEILVMWSDFARWLQTPITDADGVPLCDAPLRVLSRR